MRGRFRFGDGGRSTRCGPVTCVIRLTNRPELWSKFAESRKGFGVWSGHVGSPTESKQARSQSTKPIDAPIRTQHRVTQPGPPTNAPHRVSTQSSDASAAAHHQPPFPCPVSAHWSRKKAATGATEWLTYPSPTSPAS
jgi:hypothetical protein